MNTALSTFVASLLLVAACVATATALAAITKPDAALAQACRDRAAANTQGGVCP